jgi:putative acetyltransferase
MEIRPEQPDDASAIHTVITAAFKDAPRSHHTEAAIVDDLRDAGALTLSLVAVEGETLVGHIAFSAVTINGETCAWYGLGPLSVQPDRQRQGIGQSLVRTGLDRLRGIDAQGCVVLGDPDFYGRFGFVSDPNLRYPNGESEYFQRLAFNGAEPTGEVSYHAAFYTTRTDE